jgi:ribosome-binding protein aMBF1 (putative translation factor)
VVRALNALARIAAVISSLPTLEAIQRSRLDSVFEAIPAEHGAMTLCEEGSETFASAVSRHRRPHEGPVQVSRTAVSRAVREHLALLSHDARRTFGRAVRRAHEQVGLSQEDFAEQAGNNFGGRPN